MNCALKTHLNLTFSRGRSGTKPLQPEAPGEALFCAWSLQAAHPKVISAAAPLWCLHVKPGNRGKSLLTPKVNSLITASPSAQTEPRPGEPHPTTTPSGGRPHTIHGPFTSDGGLHPPALTPQTPRVLQHKGNSLWISVMPPFIDPQKHLGWKRPPRSLSPTLDQIPPWPLHHITKCQVYLIFELFQGW